MCPCDRGLCQKAAEQWHRLTCPRDITTLTGLAHPSSQLDHVGHLVRCANCGCDSDSRLVVCDCQLRLRLRLRLPLRLTTTPAGLRLQRRLRLATLPRTTASTTSTSTTSNSDSSSTSLSRLHPIGFGTVLLPIFAFPPFATFVLVLASPKRGCLDSLSPSHLLLSFLCHFPPYFRARRQPGLFGAGTHEIRLERESHDRGARQT